MSQTFDALTLERAWSRLKSIADEADASVMRTAFSSIIRDSHDYSCAFYDARGYLMSQPGFVTPGLLGGMTAAIRAINDYFPFQSLVEGDVIITNDPWLVCGHLPDVMVAAPVFHHGKLVAFAACVFHHQDIGGRLGVDNREIFEEGLQIPPSMLCRAGQFNEDLIGVMSANSRMPELLVNDIRSQVNTVQFTGSRIRAFLDEFGWDSLEPIADAIFERTEVALRKSIEEIPDGVYRSEYPIETGDGDRTVLVKLALTVDGGSVTADFEGSDPQIDRGINCVLNFTIAYCLFALKSVTAPFLPNNHGSTKPFTVKAPEGSIVNAKRPAAVIARNTVGHFIPSLVYEALAEVVPEKVIAESGSLPTWWLTLAGTRHDGRPFMVGPMFSGGIGARSSSDGVSCLTFPANVNNTPVELLESDSPLIVERREYLQDSGGAGRYRGGLGQEFALRVPDDDMAPDGPVVEFLTAGRFSTVAKGVSGGGEGSLASAILNGEPITWGKSFLLNAGDRISYRTAGGGGYGAPGERDRELVAEELREGLISAEAAFDLYGLKSHG